MATVTRVRADKHNALDQAMFDGLMNAAEQLAGDVSVRAVVLHGELISMGAGWLGRVHHGRDTWAGERAMTRWWAVSIGHNCAHP